MRQIYRILMMTLIALSLSNYAYAVDLKDLLVEKGIISSEEAATLSREATAEMPRFKWDKGLKFEDPDNGFSSTLYIKYKGGYSYTRNDKDAGREDVSSFNTSDFWFGSAGGFLNNEFKYKLEANLAGTSSQRLRDAYLEWVGNPLSEIRLGQFKTPISKQFNVSAFALQFSERTIVSNLVNFNRQHGVGWKANLAENRLQVGASMFNGSSSDEGLAQPGTDTKHSGFVFSRLNVLGKINDQEEGDYHYSTEPAISFGSAYGHSSANIEDATTSVREGMQSNAATVDANLKFRGYSLHSEFFWRENDFRSNTDGELYGFYVQSGYFFVPKKWEFAARYSYADCDQGNYGGKCKGNDAFDQASAVVSYYIWGPYLRAQLGYDYLREKRSNPAESNYGTHKMGLTMVGTW